MMSSYTIYFQIDTWNSIKSEASRRFRSTYALHRSTQVNFELVNKIVAKDLIVGLSKMKFSKNHICDACQKGKQTMVSFKSKNVVSTSRPLELLHMDLFGPHRLKT